MLSTQIACSTAPAAVLSSATTWANNLGGTLYQPSRLWISNHSTAVSVYLSHSNSTAAAGFGLPPLATIDLALRRDDSLFALTSAGATATLGVLFTV